MTALPSRCAASAAGERSAAALASPRPPPTRHRRRRGRHREARLQPCRRPPPTSSPTPSAASSRPGCGQRPTPASPRRFLEALDALVRMVALMILPPRRGMLGELGRCLVADALAGGRRRPGHRRRSRCRSTDQRQEVELTVPATWARLRSALPSWRWRRCPGRLDGKPPKKVIVVPARIVIAVVGS